jgi:hypothetical protein
MKLKAFCISLPKRADRRKDLDAAWDASGLNAIFDLEFIPGVQISPNIQGPQRVALCDLACAASHRRAIAMAAAEDAEGVLVLEDDAVPVNSRQLHDFLFTTLAKAPHWNTVNLGGCRANWRPATPALRFSAHEGGELFTVRGMVTTHAILYHRNVYDDVLVSVPCETEIASGAIPPTCRPYDQWLASHGTMLTGCRPYFVQSGSSSDILGMPHGQDIAALIQDTYARLRSSCQVPPLA